MGRIGIGSRVRIDIPDETDADHSLHGEHGEIVDVIRDDASSVTGRDVDDDLYRVKLDDEDSTVDLRARDLRPPLD
ncbi:hypothetical protein [Halorubrum sp. DTA98]|uniref:hypothetical protein n=1 Tax=Halorubrum sp. DTA98 TaxID=3402163 RepID=UPI003AABFD4C